MTLVGPAWYCKTKFIVLMSPGEGEVWVAAAASNRTKERGRRWRPQFRGHRGLGVRDQYPHQGTLGDHNILES